MNNITRSIMVNQFGWKDVQVIALVWALALFVGTTGWIHEHYIRKPVQDQPTPLPADLGTRTYWESVHEFALPTEKAIDKGLRGASYKWDLWEDEELRKAWHKRDLWTNELEVGKAYLKAAEDYVEFFQTGPSNASLPECPTEDPAHSVFVRYYQALEKYEEAIAASNRAWGGAKPFRYEARAVGIFLDDNAPGVRRV